MQVLTILSIVQAVVFFTLIFLSAGSDAIHGKVQNLPCAIAVVTGIFLSTLRGGLWQGGLDAPSLGASVLGCGIGFALYFTAYWLGGLGAGDVKLIAGIGALGYGSFVLWTIFYAALCGVPLALVTLVKRNKLKEGLRGSLRSMVRWRVSSPKVTEDDNAGEAETGNTGVTIPYAVAIAAGALWALWHFYQAGKPLPFGQG